MTVKGEFAGMVDKRAFLLLAEDGENKAVVRSVDPIDVAAEHGAVVEVTDTARGALGPRVSERVRHNAKR